MQLSSPSREVMSRRASAARKKVELGSPDFTVFVVDDDNVLREAIREVLISVGHAVETFSSVEEFVARRHADTPGCLVLDVRLPGMSGLGLHKVLCASDRPMPTIFITGHADTAMTVEAMKSGAVDFLAKPFRDQDLLDAIQSALHLDRKRRDEERQVAAILASYRTLTPREREVMWLVVEGQISKQIALATNISEATVKIHRSQMMRKMGAPSLPSLVRMADELRRNGIA